MINTVLMAEVKRWIRDTMRVPISEMRDGVIPVVAADSEAINEPLRAVKLENKTVLIAREDWVDALRKVVSTLHPDILFSTFGAYELARITLPEGVSIWGPEYYLFGDESTVNSVANDHVQHIKPDDLGDFDYSIFWHCYPNAQAGFVVLDKGQVLALATVRNHGDPFWEIGMDVTPNARRNGLGKAVVETAARWILEQGKLIVASAAPFNSPSLRTLRSVGLNYVFTTMRSSEMPMKIFPQQLGVPLPNIPLYNYYPDWAMNDSILPRKN